MTFDFIKYKETINLRPIEIKNKEEYIHDLANLEHSTTGRIDAMFLNTFIFEASQLILNSIFLFEKGYFDCAYYSLRQSLEVSTTIAYLVELEPDKRNKELSNWKKQSTFPMYGEMFRFLKNNNAIFSEINEKMNEYFSELESAKKYLNKYVHKQGFNTFYISRNHFINSNKDTSVFLNQFLKYLRICIGALAVLRLTIDPLPILLADEEIYLRTGDFITEGYSEEFIDKYIGEKHIKNYKETEVYKSAHEYFMSREAKLPCVADVVKYQYVNKERIDIILKQKHLLSNIDLIAVLIFYFSENVATIYFYDGLGFYFSSTKSVRKNYGYSGKVFIDIKKSNNFFNNPFNEAFLTYLRIDNEDFFIEHNRKLAKIEINKMLKSVNDFLKNINKNKF